MKATGIDISSGSRFVFDAVEYKLKTAELTGSLADPYWCDTYNHGAGKELVWGITIESIKRETDDGEISPSVEFTVQARVSNWANLAEFRQTWSKPIDARSGSRYGMTYVWDHQLIFRGDLQIRERAGDRFQLVASGKNEHYQQFDICAPLKFVGIYVHGRASESAQAIHDRLSRAIDTANLRAGAVDLSGTYDSGVRMSHTLFSPVVDLG